MREPWFDGAVMPCPAIVVGKKSRQCHVSHAIIAGNLLDVDRSMQTVVRTQPGLAQRHHRLVQTAISALFFLIDEPVEKQEGRDLTDHNQRHKEEEYPLEIPRERSRLSM